jgi:hypothetical protein
LPEWLRRFSATPVSLFLGAFLFYFVLFLGIALEGPDGRGYFRYSLGATAEELTKIFGYGDAGSYALGARSVFQNGGWFGPEANWIITLWPPGLPFIEGTFMRLFGENVRLALCLAVLSCVMWATTFACCAVFLRKYASLTAALLSPLLLLATGLFRDFFLRNAHVYSEALSTSGWMLSMVLLALACQRRRVSLAVLSGLALALSAYVRGIFSFLAVILVAHAALVTVVMFVRQRPRGLKGAWGLLRGSPVAYLLVSALAFQAFTVPYRIYNYKRLDSFGWIFIAHSWSQQWQKPEKLIATGGGWLAAGGSGMACKVDPVQCDEIEKAEVATGSEKAYSGKGALTFEEFEARAKRVLFTRPHIWAAHKAVLFPTYWFSLPAAFAPTVDESREYIQNGFFLLAALLALLLVLRDLYRGRADALTLSAAGLVATHLLVFVVFHYEVRYTFPLKLGAALIVLMWAVRAVAERAQAAQGEPVAPAAAPASVAVLPEPAPEPLQPAPQQQVG